ncbi:ABC transporter substrate-binding protein [Paenibacillus sp. MY03]|uniref:ABC transporter substrate-binding protein n=1 Tax=Paenibacillus sp. MY03 TaxID=302980 RepID=UPI0011811710|nr:ABC transporter substrate-binding protein [Paenibacillus sp. MY03]
MVKLKTVKITAALLSTVLLLGACGSPEPDSSEKPDSTEKASTELKEVELTWHYPLVQQQSDQQLIEDEVNKITKEKINATVKLLPIDIGNYGQKLNTVAAAREDIDLIWTGYLFNYEQNARKGAFLPIDDLLAQYAPNLMKDVPEYVWDGLRIDGEIHAIPNMQLNFSQNGLLILKDLVDKYNIDVSKIKTFEDIEPVLEIIKQNEPDMIPYGGFGGDYYPYINNYWSVGPYSYVKRDDSSHTIVADLPEKDAVLELYRKWQLNGYFLKDAALAKQNDYLSKGKIAVNPTNTLKPGVESDAKTLNGGLDVVAVPISEVSTNGWPNTSDTAIGRYSKNPERAMMFLELLNSDKELYNLLSYGIDGKHYEKVNDNQIKVKAESGYNPNIGWVFGNTFNGYVRDDQPADMNELIKKENENATVNPYGAFRFNSDPVKTELANIKAVQDEFDKGLYTGSFDLDKVLPEYKSRLEKAGKSIVVNEVKKQFDAWLTANGMKK